MWRVFYLFKNMFSENYNIHDLILKLILAFDFCDILDNFEHLEKR